jgi:hypothetical protein
MIRKMIRKIIRVGKSELLIYITTWKYLEHHPDIGKIAIDQMQSSYIQQNRVNKRNKDTTYFSQSIYNPTTF